MPRPRHSENIVTEEGVANDNYKCFEHATCFTIRACVPSYACASSRSVQLATSAAILARRRFA